MLGKLPVLGRPTNLDYSRARAYCACSRCGWGCLDIFSPIYHFSFLSPSLLETARYRLKYCLIGPLSPKRPTNQPITQSRSFHQKQRIYQSKLSGPRKFTFEISVVWDNGSRHVGLNKTRLVPVRNSSPDSALLITKRKKKRNKTLKCDANANTHAPVEVTTIALYLRTGELIEEYMYVQTVFFDMRYLEISVFEIPIVVCIVILPFCQSVRQEAQNGPDIAHLHRKKKN